MIMIINKLIALLPNPRQEVFHTRGWPFVGSARSHVDRPGLVRRPAGTHRQLRAVALDRTPHFDAAGRFIHACFNCGCRGDFRHLMRVDPVIPRCEKYTLVIEAIGDLQGAGKSSVTFLAHWECWQIRR